MLVYSDISMAILDACLCATVIITCYSAICGLSPRNRKILSDDDMSNSL